MLPQQCFPSAIKIRLLLVRDKRSPDQLMFKDYSSVAMYLTVSVVQLKVKTCRFWISLVNMASHISSLYSQSAPKVAPINIKSSGKAWKFYRERGHSPSSMTRIFVCTFTHPRNFPSSPTFTVTSCYFFSALPHFSSLVHASL